MDHAITVRDLLIMGGIGLALLAVVCGFIWFVSQFNTDL